VRDAFAGHPDVDVHFPEEREGLVLGRRGAEDDEDEIA